MEGVLIGVCFQLCYTVKYRNKTVGQVVSWTRKVNFSNLLLLFLLKGLLTGYKAPYFVMSSPPSPQRLLAMFCCSLVLANTTPVAWTLIIMQKLVFIPPSLRNLYLLAVKIMQSGPNYGDSMRPFALLKSLILPCWLVWRIIKYKVIGDNQPLWDTQATYSISSCNRRDIECVCALYLRGTRSALHPPRLAGFETSIVCTAVAPLADALHAPQ